MSIQAHFNIRIGDFTLDVDLQIPEQGVSALFGPSGCGKTTLLRAIAGLDCYAGGKLTVNSQTWQDKRTFLPPHKRPVGYVFQENRLFSHLTVKQNIEYGFKRVPELQRRISVQEIIKLMNVSHMLGRRPDGLSGGEKQRVAISRALAVSPRLLLMDEPLAALDQQHKQDILPYIESVSRTLQIPVLYVSHSTDEVARLADHLILLDQGQVTATGPISELLTRLDLPLSQTDDAESLIEAQVAQHDNGYNLTYVDFSGGRFTLPRKMISLGNNVRLRVLARDVSLTLQHQT